MNKICTSIEQSKKLMELGIDVDTADMYWFHVVAGTMVIYEPRAITLMPHANENISAWSLTALLELIPPGNILLRDALSGKYKCINTVDSNLYDNPVDAAFEMIIWLKENKKI